jgi:hypothetical protein
MTKSHAGGMIDYMQVIPSQIPVLLLVGGFACS